MGSVHGPHKTLSVWAEVVYSVYMHMYVEYVSLRQWPGRLRYHLGCPERGREHFSENQEQNTSCAQPCLTDGFDSEGRFPVQVTHWRNLGSAPTHRSVSLH